MLRTTQQIWPAECIQATDPSALAKMSPRPVPDPERPRMTFVISGHPDKVQSIEP